MPELYSEFHARLAQIYGEIPHQAIQEDATISKDLGGGVHLFGVLDGHGGHEVAEVVSMQLPLFLQSNQQFKLGNYSEALRETFKQMDEWLVSKEGLQKLIETRFQTPIHEVIAKIGKQKGKAQHMLELVGSSIIEETGCTANIVLIDPTTIYCANIGDSRSACVQNGNVVIMSFDHKPENRKERTRIQRAGGFVMDGRVCGALSLSRAFGDYQYKGEENMVIAEPDITTFSRKDTQLVFLACDGIWEGCMQDYGETIVKQIHKLHKKQQSGQQILQEIMNSLLATELTDNTMWGLDNMSCVLIELKQPQQQIQKQRVSGVQKKKIRK